MVALQIISKVLATKDFSFIEENLLDAEYFGEYAEEFQFIKEHYEQYGNVPDEMTFLSQFPDVDLVEVTETDKYLLDTIREEYMYYMSVPIIQKAANLLKTDANAAAEYMLHAVKSLQPDYRIGGIDIIHQSQSRLDEYVARRDSPNDFFFTTGFQELDDLIHGWQRKEEFVVILARTNQGKSWVLEKTATHVWQTGFNVGYISPEMGASSVGYRFDTLNSKFSNTDLMCGKDGIDEQAYQTYLHSLKERENKFMVATPQDFGNKITISKLRSFVKQNNLDFLAIDGITYLTDERGKRNDNKTTSLANISEDLMILSSELEITVIAVVQANRGGIVQKDDETPELESIRDSDAIAHSATKVLSLRLKDRVLTIEVKKIRVGVVGAKVRYQLDVNVGDFKYLPSVDSVDRKPRTIERAKASEKKEDVF